MADKYLYIQNKHNAPIQANARGADGKVIFTKKFMPALTEKWTGKVLHTGYEKLTEEEYKQLVATSKTFKHFSEKLKLLVAHDDIPSDLKTPHEALIDARKDAKKAAAAIKALEDEVVGLKAKLLDAEEKYKELSSASGDPEKLNALNTELTAAVNTVQGLVKLNEGFLSEILNVAGKDKDVQKLVEKHREGLKDILTVKK